MIAQLSFLALEDYKRGASEVGVERSIIIVPVQYVSMSYEQNAYDV